MIFECLLVGVLGAITLSNGQMEVLHGWRTVDFTFPSVSSKNAMLRTGRFIPENIALIDVDVWGGYQGRKVFVTMPRLKPGTPATLATVGLSNILTPYPDWSWHREGDCDGMTSVFRIQVDDCNRLWVLDSGTVDIFTKDTRRICPPQILVFDLYSDRLIGRYQFPDHVLNSDSLLITIAVDTRGQNCQNTFAYVADVVGFKLIVFDALHHRSWRISSNYFYPYPTSGNFDINGVRFDLMDGIIGLALGPIIGGDRKLYFHSLASVRESWVPTSVIRNETNFFESNSPQEYFFVSEFTRPSQSAAEAMTPAGVLFFGLLSNNSIACWNSKYPYTPENIISVAQDDYALQFQSGIKIHNGYIWVLTSRFQNYFVENVDAYDINYRIIVGSIPHITYGTSCYEPADSELLSPLSESYSPFYDRIIIKK